MFGNRKKVDKPKRNHSGKNLAQYGLFDMPSDMNFDGGMDGGDEDNDLEAELDALTGGSDSKPKISKQKPQIVDNLDEMIATSMQDVPSDTEISDDDDDPELLNELSEITGNEEGRPEIAEEPTGEESNDTVKLLEERLKMYDQAEQNAKTVGESSRARRFNRGIKTLKDLIKQAKSGKVVNSDDIPPEISLAPRKPADELNDSSGNPTSEEAIQTPAAPTDSITVEDNTTASSQIDQSLINMLIERMNQYKIAALQAKKSGDNSTALSYIKIAKQFDHVIETAQKGQPVDLSLMPEAPESQKLEDNQIQGSNAPEITLPEGDVPDEPLIVASSIEEALQQRLDVYKKQEIAAKDQGNSSKARRMGRIVKQYEQAIKLHKAGKPIPVDDLPTPPGYGTIPIEGATTPKSTPLPSQPPPEPKPDSPSNNAPSTSQSTRISGNHVPNSRAEKQLILLLAKQKEFKLAALNAKKKGEIEQAKEYLKTAKGFNPLIEAATCGLPVDLSTIPISPTAKSQLEEEYDVVMTDECTEDDKTDLDVISRLETQLTKQLKMCLTTRDHHKALGDVAGTNRFERLALSVTKDLDLVRLAHRTAGAGIPKFHYEMKDFSIVKSFTDLNDNDLELTIIRGISYTCTNSKEIDTYVKFEIPFPQEEPFSGRTTTVKNTNSPEYNQSFIIPIQRTARACQRVFKRHSIKLEIYSKGGFFRSDTLIGVVNVKLQHLENQCELHESFDLIEGRKKVGGKLEVRLRLRHPIVAQQVEQLQEKWLIIDN